MDPAFQAFPAWGTDQQGRRKVCSNPQEYEAFTGIAVDEMCQPLEAAAPGATPAVSLPEPTLPSEDNSLATLNSGVETDGIETAGMEAPGIETPPAKSKAAARKAAKAAAGEPVVQ